MTLEPVPGLVLALLGVLAGLLAPWLVRRVPEPAEPKPGKTPYAEIGSGRRVVVLCAVLGAVLGAPIGLVLGWHALLPAFVVLIAVGLALAVIDARTRLLPTYLIAPTYGVVLGILTCAALLQADLSLVIRAAIGWVVMGGIYGLLWLIAPRLMGYGDVRLAGVLGIVLGAVSPAALITGLEAGFLLGGLYALPQLLRGRRGQTYAHGPFLLLGAWAGLVLGDWVLAQLLVPA